jgi:Icc-related predicted phosphoesterase/predicted nucleotidyltransferase
MRVIFATDIHHAFRQLNELLEKTEADLYLIGGDLVSRAFFRYQTAWRFMELQQILAGYKSRVASEDTLYQLAKQIVKGVEKTTLYSQAHDYLRLCKQAEAYLHKAYGQLEEIFARHYRKSIYTLPGNYDMDLRQTALKQRNLHLHCIELDCGRLAGYGGANVATPAMPDHLQVPYRENRYNGKAKSEALDFFRKTRPDVLVLHQPAYGYLDYLPEYGNVGSHGIRDYLDEASVKLVLSGHHHEHWGATRANGTVFLNPSNFGTTMEIPGARQGGYFLEFSLQRQGVKVATLRKLEKGLIYDILDYQPSNGVIDSVILDEKRYTKLGGKAPKVHHIAAIRRLQHIKSFFLGYETPETQNLIRELRDIYRTLQKEGMEVAFDLLGSLSFGMAQKKSDMDVVVYMRSQDCILDYEDTCGVPRPLKAVFKALEERDLNVEVCDSLDLDRVKRAIVEKDREDGQLQRFIFYRLVCRPVNLRVIKRVENLLLQKENFRREMEKGLKEYLDILVSSVRHIGSFEKYKTRLRERGIRIRPDVEEAIRNYLRG